MCIDRLSYGLLVHGHGTHTASHAARTPSAPESREPRASPRPATQPPPHARGRARRAGAGAVFACVLIMKRGLVSHVATDRNEPHCLATASERLQRSRHSAASYHVVMHEFSATR